MSQGWNFFTLLKWGVLPLFCGEKVGVQRPTWGACWKTSVLEIRNLGAKHIERFIRWRNPETLKPFPKICGETIKSDYNLMIFLAVGYTLPPWDGSEADPSSTDWAQPTRDVGFRGLGNPLGMRFCWFVGRESLSKICLVFLTEDMNSGGVLRSCVSFWPEIWEGFYQFDDFSNGFKRNHQHLTRSGSKWFIAILHWLPLGPSWTQVAASDFSWVPGVDSGVHQVRVAQEKGADAVIVAFPAGFNFAGWSEVSSCLHNVGLFNTWAGGSEDIFFVIRGHPESCASDMCFLCGKGVACTWVCLLSLLILGYL